MTYLTGSELRTFENVMRLGPHAATLTARETARSGTFLSLPVVSAKTDSVKIGHCRIIALAAKYEHG